MEPRFEATFGSYMPAHRNHLSTNSSRFDQQAGIFTQNPAPIFGSREFASTTTGAIMAAVVPNPRMENFPEENHPSSFSNTDDQLPNRNSFTSNIVPSLNQNTSEQSSKSHV